MNHLETEIISQRLDGVIDEMGSDIVRAIQESIRIKSTEGLPTYGKPFGEGPAAALHHALELGVRLGFHTKNLGNAIGYVEFGQGDEMIAVLGHLDVVPAADGWKYPPYAGEIHNGILWGRGALDDKGPIIGAIFAMKALQISGLKLSRRIRVILGTNEETGSKDIDFYTGTQEVPVMGFTPDASYPVIIAEKGILTLSLSKCLDQAKGKSRLIHLSGGTASNIVPDKAEAFVSNFDGMKQNYRGSGLASHGSTPAMGRNAIIDLMKQFEGFDFCPDLKQFISFLLKKIGEETDGKSMGIQMKDEKSGVLTLNLAMISFSSDPGNTEGSEVNPKQTIEVKINIRYPVTKNPGELLKVISCSASKEGIDVITLSHKEPLYIKKNSVLVRKLQRVYEQKTGDKAELLSIGGGTYAKAMKNIAAFGPIFPGQEDLTHQTNECISIENLMKNIKIMAAAMYALAQ